MKKKLLIFTFVLAVALFVTGCGKEKEKENSEKGAKMVGGWETVLTNKQVGLDEETLKLFNSAKEGYVGLNLEPVAILGKQVVAGTNYMFLAKGTPVVQNPETSYKVVIVYKDLQGKAEITKVSDFDFTKYTNENIDNNNQQLSGGWNTEAPGKLNMLDDEDVQYAFDKATETLTGMTYNPIAIVGKQIVSGTNYAVLCYGRASTNGTVEGIYLLTLYKDLNNNQEITSNAYIDLAEFNKNETK